MQGVGQGMPSTAQYVKRIKCTIFYKCPLFSPGVFLLSVLIVLIAYKTTVRTIEINATQLKKVMSQRRKKGFMKKV